GELEVDHLHFLLVVACRVEGRLVDEVGQVRAAETGCSTGYDAGVNVFRQRDVARVHAQDALAALEVRQVDDDAAVEAAGAEEGRVEHVGAVGGRDEDHAVIRLEAVHL